MNTVKCKMKFIPGYIVYVLSFFLTATTEVSGHKAACMVLEFLTNWNGFASYLLVIFINLANILMLLNVCMLFFLSSGRLLIMQTTAMFSSWYWFFWIIKENDCSLSDLKAGYWLWMGSITANCLIMFWSWIKHKNIDVQC